MSARLWHLNRYLLNKQNHGFTIFECFQATKKTGEVACAVYSLDEGSVVMMLKIEGNVEVF